MSRVRFSLLILTLLVTGCFEEANPPPDLRAVEPGRLRAGEMLTLVGRQLGLDPKQKEVTIGGKPAQVVSWTDTSVVVAVPQLPEGDAEVVLTKDGMKAPAKSLFVLGPGPIIQELEPRRGWPDEPAHLIGTSFGAKTGQVLLDGQALEVIAWTSQKVTFKIPAGFKGGAVLLRTESGQETVQVPVPLAQPVIQALEPTGAIPGATIFIDGLNLGTDKAKGKVFFGEVEGKVKGWNVRQIEVEVPQVESTDFKVPLTVEYSGIRSPPNSFRLPSPAPYGPLIEAGTDAGPYSEILVDSRGYPIVVWYCDPLTQVLGMRWDGFRWIDLPRMSHPSLTEGLPQPNMVKAFGFGLRATIDSKDRIHLAAVCMFDGSIFYSMYDGFHWSMEPAVAPLKRRSFQSLAIDLNAQNEPVIVCFREESGITSHTKKKDGWQSAVVDGTGGEGGWAAWVDMARTKDGALHLVYFDGGKGRLMHAQPEPAGWKLNTIDSAGIAGAYAGLAIGPKGELAASYAALEKFEIRLARFQAGKWTSQVIAHDTLMNGHTGLTFDTKGALHVLYGQRDDKSGGHIHYAVEKKGEFTTSLVAKDVGEAPRPSLTTDNKGRVHLMYYDDKRRGLVYDMKPHVPGVETRPRDIPQPTTTRRRDPRGAPPAQYQGPVVLPPAPPRKPAPEKPRKR